MSRIFFSAGEASGDAYASEIAKALKELEVNHSLEGIGGRRSREAGIATLVDSSTWGAMGIAQAIRVLPTVLRQAKKAQRALRMGPPGLFVPIDFGFVNTRLAKTAKESGWKVLYFIPPGSWRKDRQGADLPQITDQIVTPFPWSAEILNQMGAHAHFFGHPLKQMVGGSGDVKKVTGRIAVLPGSRRSELELHLPILAKSLGAEDQAEFAVAASVDLESLKGTWSRLAPGRKDIFTVGDTYGVLKRSEGGLICSGTATLEAALCGCPCVVFYKVSKLVELQARLFPIRSEFISLPNILLGRRVVCELVQYDATPVAIQTELAKLRFGTGERDAMLAAFAELKETLGPSDCLTKTAGLIVDML